MWDRVPDHLKCIPTINNYCKALPGAAHPEMNQPQVCLTGSKQPREDSSLSLFCLGPGAMSEMCAGQGEDLFSVVRAEGSPH